MKRKIEELEQQRDEQNSNMVTISKYAGKNARLKPSIAKEM